MGNILDTLNISITIKEAIELTGIALSEFVNLINNHALLAIDNKRFSDDAEKHKEESESIRIPLSVLKEDIIISYIKKNLMSGDSFNADFLAFKDEYGVDDLNRLLNNIRLLKEISKLRKENEKADDISFEKKIFNKYHFSYYSEINKLFNNVYGKKATKDFLKSVKSNENSSFCPAASTYLVYRYGMRNHPSIPQIMKDLILESEDKGSNYCLHCPHNIKLKGSKSLIAEYRDYYPGGICPTCYAPSNKGIVFGSNPTAYRIVKRVPDSYWWYTQYGVHSWNDRFGSKIVRQPPLKTNQVWFADHSQLDVLLIYGYDKDGEPILRKPWITAMADCGSGVVTGWVLTFSPDSFTIGQCLARASTVKYDSIIMGVPAYLYCDDGTDYKSNFIAENDIELKEWNNRFHRLNAEMFSGGLATTLGIEVRYAKPESPWVKPIERFFRTLQNSVKRTPGFVGKRHVKRLQKRTSQEVNRLYRSGRLLTIDRFSVIFKKLVDNFNARHIKLYKNLERIDTFIPEWCSMAPFLKKSSTHKVYATGGVKMQRTILVNDGHGRYFNDKIIFHYNSMCLDDYIGKLVNVYTLNECYWESVFVTYEDPITHRVKYIGEAFLVKPIDVIENDRFKLVVALMHRHLQERRIKKELEVIRVLSERHQFLSKHYLDEEYRDEIDSISLSPDLTSELGKPISQECVDMAIDIEARKIATLQRYKNKKN